MKAFICLAISMLLVGLLYVYVRQQFALLETHVNELKSVIKMLALPPVEQEGTELKVEKRPTEELVCVSDDESDESDDSDSDAETDYAPKPTPQVAHVMMQGHDLMQLMQQMSFPGAYPFEKDSEPAVEIEEVPEEKKGVETELQVNLSQDISEIDISGDFADKVIIMTQSYESMSVKELREKVQVLGGPSLKTKKQLVEFLEKNVSA